MTAHYRTRHAVAVITLDNPPINSLGLATRQALEAGLQKALADLDRDAVPAGRTWG